MNHECSLKLGVMAKYWEPGKVKTRLGATVGMARAAELHRSFCKHLSETLHGVAENQSFVIAPPERESEFAAVVKNWEFEHQCSGDLGRRMENWFAGPKDRSETGVRLLIGADCPTISPGIVQAARDALSGNDLVLGPACDGGYYLIGLRLPWRTQYECLLRDMPWSTDRVCELTKDRASTAGLSVSTLETMEDVDTIEELRRLHGYLEEGTLSVSPSLRADIVEILRHGRPE